MKKILFIFSFFAFVLHPLFAADNMRIFPREQGEVITGLKSKNLPEEIKINILYPFDYKENSRSSLVFLFDTSEYKIENLKNMFYTPKSKNSQAVIAAFRFKDANLTQENFDSFLEEIFAFFELNYKGESDPSKRVVLAKNELALFALNSLNKESNYFYNLGIILDNTTALPLTDKLSKKPIRIFAFSQKTNIINLQNLFISIGLKPMQNFFFKINNETSFEQFDLRYFLGDLPKIQKIKPILPKEIVNKAPFYLQVKTNYGVLDFMPTDIKFAPPILAYDAETAYLKVLLLDAKKVKIKGLFSAKKWSGKVKISK